MSEDKPEGGTEQVTEPKLAHPLRYVRSEEPTEPELDETGEPITPKGEEVNDGPAPLEEEQEVEADPHRPANIPQDSWEELQAEIAEAGELSEGAYEYLGSLGYPQAFVDQYLQNQMTAQQYQETQMYDSVGGRETWENDIAPWATKNLTPEQLNTFNEAIKSKDVTTINEAMKTVADIREEVLGKPAQRQLEGGRSEGPSIRPFASPGDYQRAIGDPRWLVDTEYTQNVRKRWQLSKARGMSIN